MKKLTIYVSAETHTAFKVAVAKKGESITDAVNKMITEYLKEQKKEAEPT